MIKVNRHAKINYLKRVEKIDEEKISTSDLKRATEIIIGVVLQPKKITVPDNGPKEKGGLPAHIYGNVAVPVGLYNEKAYYGLTSNNEYKPYKDIYNDDLIVPTVYHSNMILNNART